MTSSSINIVQLAISSDIEGFTKINDDGSYTVIINRNLCERKKKAVLYHELSHIFGDDFNRFEHASVLERMLRQTDYFKSDDDLETAFAGVYFYFHVV